MCSFLEQLVISLLENQASLDIESQETLFDDVEKVFSDEDNKIILALSYKEEVHEVIKTANQHTTPGTVGLTVFFYKQCFDIIGD